LTLNNLFAIRSSSKADLPAIRNLIRTVGINPFGLAWQRFVIAVDNKDHFIGCGQIKIHADGSKELASIAVLAEWRNQGVARAIILRLLENQSRPLYLTCRSNLQSFYTKFSFHVVTHSTDLPPYFHRLTHIAQIFRWLGFTRDGMEIMRLEDNNLANLPDI
jgi:N-acetylglutamate synthase-like GNAT family acetyltransferase